MALNRGVYERFVSSNVFFRRIKKRLSVGLFKKSGRNCFGRISSYTKSSGIHKSFRIIDWRRILMLKGFVISKEFLLRYTGFIGCVCYDVGFCSFNLLPDGLNLFSKWNGFDSNSMYGTSGFLKELNLGRSVHNIEKYPGKGGVFSRAAGTSSLIVSKKKSKVFLKLSSGKLQLLAGFCVGSYGKVSNINHKYNKLSKAGDSRLLGKKPKVRGVAMNPVDHPHGGGEGKKSNPSTPLTPWGRQLKWKKLK